MQTREGARRQYNRRCPQNAPKNLRHQQRRGSACFPDIIYRLGVGRHRNRYFGETGSAFRAGPKIEDASLTHVLRPFRGYQRISALNAGHFAAGVMHQFQRWHRGLPGKTFTVLHSRKRKLASLQLNRDKKSCIDADQNAALHIHLHFGGNSRH